eukprot:jgi/Tetstr1/447675/TSEL_035033.t1
MGASSSQPQGASAGQGPIHISHAHNWQELNGGMTPAQMVHDLLAQHGLPVSPIKRRSAGWHLLALRAEVEEARCVVAVVRDEFMDEVIRASSQESCGLQPSSWCYSELKWAVDMQKPVVVVLWPNTRDITPEVMQQLSPEIQVAFRHCTPLEWVDEEDGEVALSFGKRIVETVGGEYRGEVPAVTALQNAGLGHLAHVARADLELFTTEDVANAADEDFEDLGVVLSEADRAKLDKARQQAAEALSARSRAVLPLDDGVLAERSARSADSSGRGRRSRRLAGSHVDEDSPVSECLVAGNWAGDGDSILSSYRATTPRGSVDGASRAGSGAGGLHVSSRSIGSSAGQQLEHEEDPSGTTTPPKAAGGAKGGAAGRRRSSSLAFPGTSGAGGSPLRVSTASTASESGGSVILDMDGLEAGISSPYGTPPWTPNDGDGGSSRSPFAMSMGADLALLSRVDPSAAPHYMDDEGSGVPASGTGRPTSSRAGRMIGGIFKSLSSSLASDKGGKELPVTGLRRAGSAAAEEMRRAAPPRAGSPSHSSPRGSPLSKQPLERAASRAADAPAPQGRVQVAPARRPGPCDTNGGVLVARLHSPPPHDSEGSPDWAAPAAEQVAAEPRGQYSRGGRAARSSPPRASLPKPLATSPDPGLHRARARSGRAALRPLEDDLVAPAAAQVTGGEPWPETAGRPSRPDMQDTLFSVIPGERRLKLLTNDAADAGAVEPAGGAGAGTALRRYTRRLSLASEAVLDGATGQWLTGPGTDADTGPQVLKLDGVPWVGEASGVPAHAEEGRLGQPAPAPGDNPGDTPGDNGPCAEEEDALPGSSSSSSPPVSPTRRIGSPQHQDAFNMHDGRRVGRLHGARPGSAATRTERNQVFENMDRSLEGRPIVEELIGAQLGGLVHGLCWELGVSTMEELHAVSASDLTAIRASHQNRQKLAKFLARSQAGHQAPKAAVVDLDGSLASALAAYNLSELAETLRGHGVAAIDDLVELSGAEVAAIVAEVEGAVGRTSFRRGRLASLVAQCKAQALREIRPASGLRGPQEQSDAGTDLPLSVLVRQLDSKASAQGALRKLAGVIVSPSVREHLVQTDLVPRLLRVVENSSHAAVAPLAVSVLATLVRLEDRCLGQVAANRGSAVLAAFLSRTAMSAPGDPAGQQQALRCITQLIGGMLDSDGAADMADDLHASKAVPAIFTLLERIGPSEYGHAHGLVKSLLQLVGRLTEEPRFREEVLSSTGGVTTLVEMLPEGNAGGVVPMPAAQGERVRMALAILANLSQGPHCPEWHVDGLLSAGLLPRALALMEQPGRAEHGAAAQLVSNLSASPGARSALRDAGVVPAMTRMLSSKAARASARRALSAMEEAVPDDVQLAAEGGAQSRLPRATRRAQGTDR